MSTEQDNNKVAIDDEKFINELYTELEDELTNASDEQPSESLDQSILAAAHKAVDSKPKTTRTRVEKSPKVKKTRTWHVPLSLAASTVLVVSLVVNQGEEPVLPKELTIPEQPEVIQSDMQVKPTVGAKKPPTPKRKVMGEGRIRETSKRMNQQVAKAGSVPAQQIKKKSMKAEVEILSIEESNLVNNELAQDTYAPKFNNEKEISSNNELYASSFANSSIIPWLSTQQYMLYREGNNQCTLLEESEEYYLISVHITESEVSQYKLMKKEFNISSLPSEASGKFLFDKIKLLSNK
jgi:hypothetical protein